MQWWSCVPLGHGPDKCCSLSCFRSVLCQSVGAFAVTIAPINKNVNTSCLLCGRVRQHLENISQRAIPVAGVCIGYLQALDHAKPVPGLHPLSCPWLSGAGGCVCTGAWPFMCLHGLSQCAWKSAGFVTHSLCMAFTWISQTQPHCPSDDVSDFLTGINW